MTAQSSTSRAVYGMTTGVPVVPEELCILTMSLLGTAARPRGYASRRSALSVNGRDSKSSWVLIDSRSMPSNFLA